LRDRPRRRKRGGRGRGPIKCYQHLPPLNLAWRRDRDPPPSSPVTLWP
jgi:hypothetical protein